MDAFLSDVFDLPPGASPPPGIVENGAIHVTSLMSSPLLRTNLAFHAAWKATFGCGATRVDFWDFRSRSGPNALTECFLECSPIRMMPNAQEAMARAQEMFARSMATVQLTKRALLMKLADRFCLEPPDDVVDAVNHLNIVSAYAEIVLDRSGLAVFERWAGRPSQRPLSIDDHYARSASALEALELPERNPITRFFVMDIQRPQQISCVEALRLAIFRDGYMWRSDCNGACVVDPPPELVGPGFKFRVASIPGPAAIAVFPRGIYKRVIVPDGPHAFLAQVGMDVIPLLTEGATISDDGRRVIVCSAEPPDWDAHPRAYWVPSLDGQATWNALLRQTMIASHLAVDDPLDPAASSAGASGHLLCHQLLARYVHARGIGTKKFTPRVGPASGTIVVVDTRKNVWSVLSALVALDNLDSGAWDLKVFCATSNQAFFERHITPRVSNATVEVLADLDATEPFNTEAYNTLLKSPGFWARIGTPRVLLVQDDGVLMRPGLLLGELNYDYVGAPWADVPANAPLKAAGSLVGNGGLSLRSVNAMHNACVGRAQLGLTLFNHRMQPLPEDAFFSACAAGPNACPEAIAEKFAFEQRAPAPGVLGFHKPWPYQPVKTVADEFHAMLRDAIARSP